MHFSLATILASALLLVSASPLAEQPPVIKLPLTERSNLRLPDGSVNIEKLSRHLAASKAKFRRSLDNYERNTGKRQNIGIEPLDDEHDENTGNFFTGLIYVGTPDTQFTVVLDTNFRDIFLPASTCDSSCTGHILYDPSSSSTATSLGQTFNLWYNNDTTATTGTVYTDTITIAGLTATSQALGAATHYGPALSFSNFIADGVLGLGFMTNSIFNAPNIVNNLLSQGQITSGVVAFKLVQGDSELNIGGLNTDLYSGTPFYTPISIPNIWIIPINVFTVAGASVVGAPAALLSGTPFTSGPTVDVNLVYAQIPGSQDLGTGFHTFPCSAAIPAIVFSFGDNDNGISVTISASSFNFGPVSSGSSTCLGSIVANTPDAELWYLGDSFMRNIFTIFDYDNSQVGFANLV